MQSKNHIFLFAILIWFYFVQREYEYLCATWKISKRTLINYFIIQSTKAIMKASLAKPKKKEHIYNVESDSGDIKRTREVASKKKRVGNSSEEAPKENNLWKQWIMFLNNPDNISKFHSYRVIFGNSNFTLVIVPSTMTSFGVEKVFPVAQTWIVIYADLHTPRHRADYVNFVVNSPTIPEFKRNLGQLPDVQDSVIDFLEDVLRVSCLIGETLSNIAALKQEHINVIGNCLLSANLPDETLFTVINPNMVKLIEYNTGMFCMGPLYTRQ
ncbi:hypothetical protein K501DRAFT_273872 [Backusella circina FSU 941]|nr:hypothetical protein K501DRAFT_273872 [Backusella circina FSU 941]